MDGLMLCDYVLILFCRLYSLVKLCDLRNIVICVLCIL